MRSHFHLFTLLMFAVIGAALAGLWLQQMTMDKAVQATVDGKITATSPTPDVEAGPAPDLTAIQTTLSQLQASETDLAQRVQALEDKKSAITKTTGTNFQTQTIYLGAATSNKLEWTSTGLQATVNSASYPAGSKITFEAGLSIIGGIAYARLMNNTTGAVMAVTEISNNTSTTVWVDSPTFELTPGNNVYEVQLRSSSGEVANLAGARMIINK